MSKKVFTLLLLAVFVVAQFSVASAATVSATLTLATGEFSNDIDVDLDWSASDMPGDPVQNILIWAKIQAPAPNPFVVAQCALVGALPGVANAAATITLDYAVDLALAPVQGDVVEFAVSVDDQPCATATVPGAVMASAYVDGINPIATYANPPSLDVAGTFASHRVSCNTFEMWALGSDSWFTVPGEGYAGLGSWGQKQTGSFAPPAPVGTAPQLLEWPVTLPATASGAWSFSTTLRDAAYNYVASPLPPAPVYFRDGTLLTTVSSSEKASCVDFTDTAGHADELYIRYLADLGLIAGNPDGSYGPDNTLTRAEASALFEKANGYTVSTLPDTAPSAACSFSDVSASDWFAGWVWQACADGFMNGIGGGLFDPANTLTRGQIVTIFNNIATTANGQAGSFLEDNGGAYMTVLNDAWWFTPTPFRSAAFTDVPIGAFYAVPVQRAYSMGVVEGTSDTTFSPDEPATRGTFAMWLYRALSRYD